MAKTLQIGVIGAGSCDEQIGALAFEVGRQIAKAGAVLLCGGLSGVMEYACKGAKEAGGQTVGILPGPKRGAANAYVDVEIVTNVGHARNVFIAHSADALIAISGGYGTMSEISIGLKLKKPVFGLQTHDVEGVEKVDTPALAVKRALDAIH
jgi:hypothetical protein